MNPKNKIPIFPVLFKSDDVNMLYESFEYFNLKTFNTSDNSNLRVKKKPVYSYRLIPEYFKLNLRDSTFKTKIIPQFNWGYSVLLNTTDSIETFMQQQFNSKKRNIYTRYINRLEACFDIKYKTYHGEISKENYNSIMLSLYNMIVSRFKERNELHKNLYEWEYLLENTYDDIINKNASLFVIYNENKPIEVSLNYHFDKVLFSYISSYDIDYSKFGLGHVEIYKQIEWCTNNDYILFEMGVGGMDYKRRWSNNIYRYNHYVVYKKASFQLKFLIIKIQLKEYLKSKGLNEIYSKLSTLFSKQVKSSNLKHFEIEKNVDLDKNNYEEINYSDKPYSFLKRYIYDIIYNTTDNYKKLKVYKHKTEKSFLIQGENSCQKISFIG